MGSFTSQKRTKRRTGLAGKLPSGADVKLSYNPRRPENFKYIYTVTGEFTYVPDGATKVKKNQVKGTLKPGDVHKFGYTGLIKDISRRNRVGIWRDLQISPRSARKEDGVPGADRVENGSGGGTGWQGPGTHSGGGSGNGSDSKNGSGSNGDTNQGGDQTSPTTSPEPTQAGVTKWAKNNPTKATLIAAGILGGGYYLMGE